MIDLIEKIINWALTLPAKDFATAAFGAAGGAWAAQEIAEKSRSREELLKEIRNTNASIALTFSICNSFLALKAQQIAPLYKTYRAQKLEFLLRIRQLRKGKELELRSFKANLSALSLPYLPIDILQKQLFETLSIRGRALNLITTLAQTIETLKYGTQKRNELLQGYKATNLSNDALISLYFGVRYMNGPLNVEYPSSLKILSRFTDDGAFFSQMLCKDLIKHGRRLRQRFKFKYGAGAPPVDRPNFTKAIVSGLMPKNEDYAEWFGAFTRRPRSKRSLYVRVRSKWYFWKKLGLGKWGIG